MKTNRHIQIALLSIHIILILIAIMLKSKIYFPKISLFICPFSLCLIQLTLSGTHFIYFFLSNFVLLNVSPIQIRQSAADGWSETLKVQQTAISIILNSSPFANSDTKLKIGQLLYLEPFWNELICIYVIIYTELVICL